MASATVVVSAFRAAACWRLNTCAARKMTVNELAINGGPPAVPKGAHVSWPQITAADREALSAVLDRGELWGPNAPEVTALADEWASYVGASHCVVVNSGTAALHCAVVAAGVRPGDEVIVPAFSFVATPMAVLHAGANPVFCDIDQRSFNIDTSRIPDHLTARTAAIMPVHMHGLPADMDEISSIAKARGLAVIEDAAQAHGAVYKGTRVGALGDGAAFSLNGSKNLSAGEGGLFVTDDDEGCRAARRLAIFGEDTPPLGEYQYRAYWSHGTGWNYRTHELTAALARAQLKRLDTYNELGRRNAEKLSRVLGEQPGLTVPLVPADRTSVFHRYRVRFDAAALGFRGPACELRDRLIYALRAEGVAASTWQLNTLPAQPIFRRATYAAWCPAREREPLKPWDRDAYPVTSAVLEQSLVLGTADAPLFGQPGSLMGHYAVAFEKILTNLDAVFHGHYEPVQAFPPIPAHHL
jgi:dTDP-4-amino-4,6-dideoxygalactose transaminase